MQKHLELAGTTLHYIERGSGRPPLFLHAGEGLMPERPWLDRLACDFRVIAPWHPGYGESPLIEGGGSVEDLAYLYLDFAAALGLKWTVLVGICLGGWVAAEIMVRSTACFSHLVLADPRHGAVDYAQLPDSELARIVRGREAFVRYGWKPYMHNPRLRRWLHRIDRPTLILWGASDGIVMPAIGERWQAAIPQARFEVIDGAGHFPHREQPKVFADRIGRFVADANR